MPKGVPTQKSLRLQLDQAQAKLIFDLLREHYATLKGSDKLADMREAAAVIELILRVADEFDRIWMSSMSDTPAA